MKRILLAEDEDVLRMLTVDTLEDEGYAIHEAENGVEAIELLDKQDFDLLILDYMMPKMTGLEVVQHLRKNNSSIKILMLTAKSQQEDIDLLKNAGANYYMAKPFSPQKLVEAVRDIFAET